MSNKFLQHIASASQQKSYTIITFLNHLCNIKNEEHDLRQTLKKHATFCVFFHQKSHKNLLHFWITYATSKNPRKTKIATHPYNHWNISRVRSQQNSYKFVTIQTHMQHWKNRSNHWIGDERLHHLDIDAQSHVNDLATFPLVTQQPHKLPWILWCVSVSLCHPGFERWRELAAKNSVHERTKIKYLQKYLESCKMCIEKIQHKNSL